MARTVSIASGPYATDVSASRDSADNLSTGVICSPFYSPCLSLHCGTVPGSPAEAAYN